jgi:hypothetical protein
MILKKAKLPARKVTWDEIRASCDKDSDMVNFLGKFQPFLVDHSNRVLWAKYKAKETKKQKKEKEALLISY